MPIPVSVICTEHVVSALSTRTTILFLSGSETSLYLMLFVIKFAITSSICFFAPQTYTSGSVTTERSMPFDCAKTPIYSIMDVTSSPKFIFSCTHCLTVVSVRARRTKSRTISDISSASTLQIFICLFRGCFFVTSPMCAASAARGVCSPCAISASTSS